LTEPVMDFSDNPAQEDVRTPARRGRPRAQETINRDDAVLKALGDGPQTKEQLVQKLGLKDTHVYLSLWRLRRDGKVEKVSDPDTRHLWRLVV
jgi:predicted Rossmann fold nucleotide-binding protein DprA/Smf involved in DNA uptake